MWIRPERPDVSVETSIVGWSAVDALHTLGLTAGHGASSVPSEPVIKPRASLTDKYLQAGGPFVVSWSPLGRPPRGGIPAHSDPR